MGLPNWNPSSPDKLGAEGRNVGHGNATVDAAGDVEELQWEAARTGDLDTVQLFGQGATSFLGSTFNNVRRPMILDLLDQGDEAWGALTYNDFSVSAVTGSPGMVNEDLSTPITTSRLNGFDNLFIASSAINAYFDCQFSTGAYGLDRHVLAVEVVFRGNITLRVGRFDPGGQLWFRDYPFWSSGYATGAARWGEAIVQHGATTWTHWTPSMIRQFASGSTRKVRITCRAGAGAWRVDRVYLRVYSIPERRRGVGLGTPISGWTDFTMTDPPATGTPSVVTGDDYTLMLRRIIDYNNDNVAGAVLPWRMLRGRPLVDNWRRHQQSFTPNVVPASVGASLMPAAGPQVDGVLAARMLDGATVIADSQPYNLSRGAWVYGAQTATQTFTGAGGVSVYGQAFVVAGWIPTDGRPVAPLRAEVFRVSDGVRVLDAVEVSAADVERLPVSAPVNNVDDQGAVYKTVQFRFPNAASLSAVAYELRLSSPDSTEARPWRVAAMIGEAHTTDQTFAGSTGVAEGVFRDTPALSSPVMVELTDGTRSSDLLASVAVVPGAVEDVTTSVGSVTAHHAEVCDSAGCEGCADDTVPFVELAWTAAPSGSPDVAAYQVDRKDDLDPDWRRVATVWGRTTTTWQDHEARIGVASQYRVRVLREDVVTGDWSDTASATIPTGQVALAFTSNAGVGLGCVYPEVWEREVERSWRFLEAGDVTYRTFYGRNRQVAFRPIERRGDSFVRTLLLDALCTVALPTMAVFGPLRDLAWSPVPYVCVRDGEGNRWFASIELPDGTNRRADAAGTELWLTEISITEVADRPSVHDTSVAQVEGPVQL